MKQVTLHIHVNGSTPKVIQTKLVSICKLYKASGGYFTAMSPYFDKGDSGEVMTSFTFDTDLPDATRLQGRLEEIGKNLGLDFSLEVSSSFCEASGKFEPFWMSLSSAIEMEQDFLSSEQEGIEVLARSVALAEEDSSYA